MNTRKYDSKTRKKMKREQRGPEYRALQKCAAKERAELEAKLGLREKPLHEQITKLRNAAREMTDKFKRLALAIEDNIIPIPKVHAPKFDDAVAAHVELATLLK